MIANEVCSHDLTWTAQDNKTKKSKKWKLETRELA